MWAEDKSGDGVEMFEPTFCIDLAGGTNKLEMGREAPQGKYYQTKYWRVASPLGRAEHSTHWFLFGCVYAGGPVGTYGRRLRRCWHRRYPWVKETRI